MGGNQAAPLPPLALHMATSSSLSLQRRIDRILVKRLLLMVLVIGVLTGVLVYFSEWQSLRAQVVEETRVEIKLLISRTQQIVATQGRAQQEAFRQALEERLAVVLKPQNGAFVYVNFYQVDTNQFEERIDRSYPLMEAVVGFARSLPRVTPAGGKEAGLVTLGNRLHVWVIMPLTAAGGPNPAFAQVVFAPSEAVLRIMRQKLQRSLMMALLIVAVTSGLLYPVIVQLVHKLSVFSRNLLDANLDTLSLLASAIAKRDSDTDVHNFRVTLYALHLAEAMRVDNRTLQSLIKGAFVHDVGKIGVPDEILHKPGRLDAQEFMQMQAHVGYGLDIIAGSTWLDDAAKVVGGHHERFDGSGYPAGLAGEGIPLVARIFAVADVFDALTSKRPYKEPLDLPATLALLEQGRGSHFDPTVHDVFATIAGPLYRRYAGRDDQGLRDELQAVVARVFSEGKIVLD